MSKRKRRRTSGLRLIKRPESPFYQIVGSVRGKSVRQSTKTDRWETAEALRAGLERDLLLDSLPGDKGDVTFDRAWNLYIDMKPDQKTRSVQLLYLHFRDTKLVDINDEKVRAFARLHFSKLVPASLNREVYTPLIAILNLARKNRMCGGHTLTRPVVKQKMVEHAPPEWMKAFLGGCSNMRLKVMVKLMTSTACRVAEACRVRWQDIDLKRLEITLPHTKPGVPRVVPISQGLALDLIALSLTKPDDLPGYRVFKLKDRASVNQAIERQCERLGLKYYSTHKLGRHAFAHRMLKAGHTLGDVAQAGGWSKDSLKMLYKTYGHLEQQKLADATRELANELEGA